MRLLPGGVFISDAVVSASEEWVRLAQSATRILVPKSRDAVSGVAAFTQATGIEVPDSLWEKEYVKTGGRSFRLAPGGDMPTQIAAGWGDIGVCSTELLAEANTPDVVGFRVGKAVCRYSVLALDERAEEWRAFLQRGFRYPIQPRQLPASFPRFLGMIAAKRSLPLVAAGVPISGKGEATMRDSGVGAVADRVVRGDTVRKLGGREVFWLANIYPELVVREQDTSAYSAKAGPSMRK